jgi:hypothetical protein
MQRKGNEEIGLRRERRIGVHPLRRVRFLLMRKIKRKRKRKTTMCGILELLP